MSRRVSVAVVAALVATLGLLALPPRLAAQTSLEGRWQVVDATRMAPRASLVRIANGRDASDTAFLTLQSGQVTFGSVSVTCFRREGLPVEDPQAAVHL